ncbi:MAG: transcriptional repressor [Bacteroidales bacterium]|nr:transcriptional repressor [Bacteroidales bacterium]
MTGLLNKPMTMDEFRTSLKRHSLKATAQRLAVHEAMMALGHASADMVCDYLASSGSSVKVNTSSVYNILSQLALTGIYRHRLSANNKMYFDVNSARHIHLYDLSTHTFRDLPDDEFSEMVFAKLGRKRFKGFKIENVDVQILVRPTQKSSKK